MLPSEHLITRIRKGRIKPVFSNLEGYNLEIASDTVKIFENHIGRKKGTILKVLDEFEESAGTNHRFIRGLSTLLFRRCEFEVRSPMDPYAMRKLVFEEANKTGVVTKEERRTVIEKVASRLNIPVEDVEKSLWADYESEEILKEFKKIRADELLRLYNLSLAQTLLFKALSMEVYVKGNYKNILRRIKYLGLMYFAEKINEVLRISIDGPISIFKMTEKYGTSIAKLLPVIVEAEDWKIKASIVMRFEQPRTLVFELDRKSAPILETKPVEKFDSMVEEKFFHSFNSLGTSWTLKREPEPIIVENAVFLPDFSFQKGKMKFYMEIVGFWTEEYLKKKLYKIQKMNDIILAVDKSLSCSKFREFENVIYYKNKVPPKEILRYLEKYEEKIADEESKLKIEVKGDVVKVEEIARKYDISEKAAEKLAKNVEGYVLIGKELVKAEKIAFIEKKLDSLPNYKEAVSFLEREGISSANLMLEYLGYEIEWHGLDPSEALLKRKC